SADLMAALANVDRSGVHGESAAARSDRVLVEIVEVDVLHRAAPIQRDRPRRCDPAQEEGKSIRAVRDSAKTPVTGNTPVSICVNIPLRYATKAFTEVQHDVLIGGVVN